MTSTLQPDPVFSAERTTVGGTPSGVNTGLVLVEADVARARALVAHEQPGILPELLLRIRQAVFRFRRAFRNQALRVAVYRHQKSARLS